MKQTVKLIGSLIFLVCLASPVWAVKTSDVSQTVHNLGSGAFWNIYAADNVDEVCVFCHTPHGGVLTGPLWNRSSPSGTFTHYNSATLSTKIVGDTRVVNDESLICLSCHDGSVAVDHLLNKPNKIGSNPITLFGGGATDVTIIDSLGGNPYARIGATLADTTTTGDLSDDHPISFSYTAVLSDTKYTDTNSSYYGELRDSVTAVGLGVRFFTSDLNVECSSCHDPHVSYDQFAIPAGDEDYRPFLTTPNTGSALCLACHNK